MTKLIYGSKFSIMVIGAAFSYFCLMVFLLYQREGNDILGLIAVSIFLWTIPLSLSARNFLSPKFKLDRGCFFERKMLFWYQKTSFDQLSVFIKKNAVLVNKPNSNLTVKNSYANKRVFSELIDAFEEIKEHLVHFEKI